MEEKSLIGVLQEARGEIAKVIIGQQEVVEMSLITIFTGNHALIEGVPGIAKTLLVRTLGRVLDLESGRIQFVPDLMPADITGTNVYDARAGNFQFVPGPVFTSFLLADEINRAPAKTQAALLQAMQERRVTADRTTHALPRHFTVFATQNPIEYEGTYPLPEAQKDRFMMKIRMDYPTATDEVELARRTLSDQTPEKMLDNGDLRAVVRGEDIDRLKSELGKITFREELVAYVVELVRTSREHPSLATGAGPRATQALLLGCRARAALDGRDFVTPDDIKAMARPVLTHRIVLRPEYEIEGLTPEEVIKEILEGVAVPR